MLQLRIIGALIIIIFKALYQILKLVPVVTVLSINFWLLVSEILLLLR